MRVVGGGQRRGGRVGAVREGRGGLDGADLAEAGGEGGVGRGREVGVGGVFVDCFGGEFVSRESA